MASIIDSKRMPRYLKKYAASDITSLTLDQRLTLQTVAFHKTAADAADATTTSDAIFIANRDLIIVEAWFIPHGTLTADDTNYATIACKVGAVTKASALTTTTGTDDFVDNTPVALTLAAAPTIADNDVVLFDIAKAGTGVTVPIGVFQLLVADA